MAKLRTSLARSSVLLCLLLLHSSVHISAQPSHGVQPSDRGTIPVEGGVQEDGKRSPPPKWMSRRALRKKKRADKKRKNFSDALTDLIDGVDTESEQQALPNPECPRSSEGTICTLEHAPVICEGDCKYSNKCNAEAAGQNLNSCCCEDPMSSCDAGATKLPLCAGVIELIPLTGGGCPAVLLGTATNCSTTEVLPVRCGSAGCQYDNLCLAFEASFTEEACSTAVSPVCSADADCRTYGSDCNSCECVAMSTSQNAPYCDAFAANCNKELICEGYSAGCNLATSLCELVKLE